MEPLYGGHIGTSEGMLEDGLILGVLVSGCWNRGILLYIEVSSFLS